jgi:fatty-acyl-CoA synthase
MSPSLAEAFELMTTGFFDPPTQAKGAVSPHKPSAAKAWLKAIELTSRIETHQHKLFADLVQDWAVRQPDRPSLVSDIEAFSYRALAERIHRYARWAKSAGIISGKTVCLMM